MDALSAVPALRGYHLLPSVRGDLLARLGRTDEAREEFARAAGLATNAREREMLRRRAAESFAPACVSAPGGPGASWARRRRGSGRP